MKRDNIDARFKDAPWYLESANETVLIAGLGGIGSNTLYCAAKTLLSTFILVDHDKVNTHNIGTQFFMKDDIDKYKVDAISENIEKFTDIKIDKCPVNINMLLNHSIPEKYYAICISAFDNMKARKYLFEKWLNNSERQILIDGRLRANLYEIITVTRENEDKYAETLFDDKLIEDDKCTFKQTAYFGMLIGARITQILANYLTNKYAKDNICNIPFRIKENGDAFYVQIN